MRFQVRRILLRRASVSAADPVEHCAPIPSRRIVTRVLAFKALLPIAAFVPRCKFAFSTHQSAGLHHWPRTSTIITCISMGREVLAKRRAVLFTRSDASLPAVNLSCSTSDTRISATPQTPMSHYKAVLPQLSCCLLILTSLTPGILGLSQQPTALPHCPTFTFGRSIVPYESTSPQGSRDSLEKGHGRSVENQGSADDFESLGTFSLGPPGSAGLAPARSRFLVSHTANRPACPNLYQLQGSECIWDT